MSTVEAIYQDGVFKPLGTVDLRDNERVRLNIEPIDREAVRAWLSRVEAFHEEFIRKHGVLPDSTADIRADRERDL